MSDTFSFKLKSPLTEEQINLITDAEFEHTDSITFITPKGKKVEFVKAQRWIPCSERLPEKSDDVVLVTVIDERRIRDIYLMRCDEVESAYIIKWISAWMPLPKPYREEE